MSELKEKFMVLAGIMKDDTLAVLRIPNAENTVQLKKLPNWFERLKFKVCGFKYKEIRTKPKEVRITDKLPELPEIAGSYIKIN